MSRIFHQLIFRHICISFKYKGYVFLILLRHLGVSDIAVYSQNYVYRFLTGQRTKMNVEIPDIQ